jgi:hypothetical protein
VEDDPRLTAARYRAAKAAREAGDAPDGDASGASTAGEPGAGEPVTSDAVARRTADPTASDRAAYVETAIQQAIRSGAFDDLPGHGKPLDGLGEHHDPDWWIRRKIQTEQLTGLGPPAIMLRVEHGQFAQRLDELSREDDVREYVEDFNRRVIEARRQLLGGPPVITPTHDVDAELAQWRERRAARLSASAPPAEPRRRRGLRRRSRRAGEGGEGR